jgi:hypothetical protein
MYKKNVRARPPSILSQIFAACALVAFASPRCPAQSAAGGDPQTVLEHVLVAACGQKQTDFARSLTARNTEAFAHLTPAAQATLLKRFVLLDGVGEARAEAGSDGVLNVSCVTAKVTTLMQINKPDVRENLAYVPLVIKDATDANDASTHRVTMGFVREKGEWKLLSLGLLLLDLPTLGEEWDRAEMKSNEESAVAHVKELAGAIETYRKTYTRLPDALADLGPDAKGAPKSDKAGLVPEDLALGRKDGYAFRYVIVGANNSGAPAKYEIAAIPMQYGRTGTRSFFRDSAGGLHAADRQGSVGSEVDPKID